VVAVENPYAGQGSVLLDIGGAVGALVVAMPAEMGGVEVEISRRGNGAHRHDQDHDHDHDHDDNHDHAHNHTHRPHVAVVARPVSGGFVHSLVFAELVEGDYELYRLPDGPVELSVSVSGGTVTEATWPTQT
jgi:hypothetical protein